VRESEEIDRDRWQELLSRLLREAGLSPERAASSAGGPVPANARTIRKWMSRETGVGAARVRDVARSLGYSPTRALLEVGFFTADEFGVTGLAAPPTTSNDPLIRRLIQSLSQEAGTPEPARNILRRLLQGAYESWLAMQGIGGHEPSASARTRRTPTSRPPK